MCFPFLALLLPCCKTCLKIPKTSAKSKDSNKEENANEQNTQNEMSIICQHSRVHPIKPPIIYNFEPFLPISDLPPPKTKPITLFEINEFHNKNPRYQISYGF